MYQHIIFLVLMRESSDLLICVYINSSPKVLVQASCSWQTYINQATLSHINYISKHTAVRGRQRSAADYKRIKCEGEINIKKDTKNKEDEDVYKTGH